MPVQMEGAITYNGHALSEFNPIRTAAYVHQEDVHIAELTVRETLNFAARMQGPGVMAGANHQWCSRGGSSTFLTLHSVNVVF